MAEPDESPKQNAPETKRPGQAGARSLAARAERSLKDTDRILRKDPTIPAAERAMVQMEQAKVAALLQLAQAIREARSSEGSTLP
jgi:hypothetical protein